jgi:ATP-dependent Clp protease ATP-binding subunit ClpA
MFERYTEKARRAIFFARYEASQFGVQFIDANCLLLGLVRENGQISTRWLALDATDLHRLVESQIIRSKPVSTSIDMPLTNDVKRVLAYAAEEAERLSHRHIGTEHLFLGLLHEPETFAAQRIKELGKTLEQLRTAIAQEAPPIEGGSRATPLSRGFKVRLMSETGEELATLQWTARLPAIGEALSIADKDGTETHYRVLDLAWRVQTLEGSITSQVKEVVLKVRKEPS